MIANIILLRPDGRDKQIYENAEFIAFLTTGVIEFKHGDRHLFSNLPFIVEKTPTRRQTDETNNS